MCIHQRQVQVKFLSRHHNQRVAGIIAHDNFRLTGVSLAVLILIGVADIYPCVLLEGCFCRTAGSVFHRKLNCLILCRRLRCTRKSKAHACAAARSQGLNILHACGFRNYRCAIHALRCYHDILRRNRTCIFQIKGNREILIHAVGTTRLLHIPNFQNRLSACHTTDVHIKLIRLFVIFAELVAIFQLNRNGIIPCRHIRRRNQRELKGSAAANGNLGNHLAVKAARQADAFGCQVIQRKLHLIHILSACIHQPSAQFCTAARTHILRGKLHIPKRKPRL